MRVRRPFAQGVWAALALPAWIVGFSFLGVGSLAVEAGHPLGAALLSTILVFAAPAQLILYGSLASGGLVVAAGLAVGFSAIRLLPMTLSLMPYLRRPGQSLAEQLALAHLVAATNWIEGMRRLPELEPAARVPYFAGFGGACFVVCVALTALGYLLLGALPGPLAAGMLMLVPIYFTVSMAGGARQLGDALALVAGLALLPLAQALVGRDFDILATGLVGGSAAYAVGRWRRRRTGP